MSAIYKTVNINADVRVFVNASHSAYFSEKHKTQMKLNRIFFGKSQTHFCRECYDLDMCQNLEKNIIVIRNGKIVWKVVWIEHYLRLNLSSRRYQYPGHLRIHRM